jgi:glutathione peroxidase-family protein
MLQSEAKSSQGFVAKLEQIISAPQQSCLTRYEEGFFQIFTAASLNHKEARFFYSLFIENGIIPAPHLVEEMTAEGMKYNYLRYLVDTETSLPFKFNNSSDSAYFKLSEFESDSKAQSLANLYLSA